MSFNKYRLKGAFHYNWYEKEDWYKYLIDRAVKFCKGKTIDFGCGDGVLLSKLPRLSIGLDNDLYAIDLCKQAGLNAYHTNTLATDYLEYDYLACINTIEHLEHPEIIKKLIKNHVSKGAIITTIDYQGGALGEDHKFEWTYDEMMNFFKEFNPKGFRYKDTEWIGVEITK